MTLPASHDILFETASQTVYLDVLEGRPTHVSLTVYEDSAGDEGQTESAITGTPAVETNPNTTTDAACGPGSVQTNMKKIPVTATTGFTKLRQYLITDATTGESEWFECTEIVSADYVTARSPLTRLFASGSTVQSTRLTATIDTTWASDENNLSDPFNPNPRYRLAWVYTVGGVTYRPVAYANLVRIDGALHGVTPIDVEREAPGWIDRLPTNHRSGQGKTLIEQAALVVKRDLYSISRTDWAQRNSFAFQTLIVMQAVVLGHRANFEHGGDNVAQLDRAEAKYAAAWDKWINAAIAAEQLDTSGAGGKPDMSPIFVR